MSDVEPAGRPLTAKGAERRAALVAAGGALFLESGTEGFTHRAVAQRAGVPLSATTYYFDSLEDLLVESVAGLCASWTQALEAALGHLPARLSRRALAQTLVEVTMLSVVTDDPPVGELAAVAFYQRSVEAGRHPALWPAMRQLNDAVERSVADLLGRAGLSDLVQARLLLAVLDGAMIRALAEGHDPTSVVVIDLVHFLGGS